VSGEVVHGRVPLAAIVMVIELHIAREKTCQLSLLGIDLAPAWPATCGGNIRLGKCCQTCLRVEDLACQHVMLKIIAGLQEVSGIEIPSVTTIIS
jgi:hypothetical protein